MTPTTQEKVLDDQRRSLAIMTMVLFTTSLSCILFAGWWITPLDYWLLWGSFFTGMGTIVAAVVTIIFHLLYLEEARR